MTLGNVPETRDEEATGIDWAGLVTFSAALFALVLALIRGNEEGSSSAPIVALLAGAALLLALALVLRSDFVGWPPAAEAAPA